MGLEGQYGSKISLYLGSSFEGAMERFNGGAIHGEEYK